MATINAHLEQINIAGAGIQHLEFAAPGVFTNAVLHQHDITALIRDTEGHEQALFKINPAISGPQHSSQPYDHERQIRQLQSHTKAFASEILAENSSRLKNRGSRQSLRSELDIEALLENAAQLCNAYPIDGALEKIEMLRTRHNLISDSIEKYNEMLAAQGQSSQINMSRMSAVLQDEQAELDDLEMKKKMLEERVANMDKDLGGLRA